MIPNTQVFSEGKETDWEEFLRKCEIRGIAKEELIGVLGGRFMPFHLGHMATLELLAKQEYRLHIGVVNPDPWDTKLEGERFTLDKNFLTYAERLEAIGRAVSATGKQGVTYGPYYPARWYGEDVYWSYVPGRPETTLQYIALRDDFDRAKFDSYMAKGRNLVVVPLVEGDGVPYSATEIRKRMVAGEDSWRGLVTPGMAGIIDRNGVVDRLLRITRGETARPAP